MVDLIDLYDRGTAWTATKIPAATEQLDGSTPCEQWSVRDLLNHIVAGQKLFEAGAQGQGPSGPPPPGKPEPVISDDPAADYEAARKRVVEAYQQEGALDKGAMLLGIGFVDQIVHGWDLAKATGQDTVIPDDLAEAAMGLVGGRLTQETRGHSFASEVPVDEDVPAGDKLVAYLGRDPA